MITTTKEQRRDPGAKASGFFVAQILVRPSAIGSKAREPEARAGVGIIASKARAAASPRNTDHGLWYSSTASGSMFPV